MFRGRDGIIGGLIGCVVACTTHHQGNVGETNGATGTGADSTGAGDVGSGAGDGSGSGNAFGSKIVNDGGSGGDLVGACVGGDFMRGLGRTKVMVGGAMTDATASATPIDLRYLRVSGGISDGNAPCQSCASSCNANGHTCANAAGQAGCGWWGCAQSDAVAPGQVVRDFLDGAKSATRAYIPMLTYYEILNASGATAGTNEIAALSNVALMRRYFADWRFLLQQVDRDTAILHIEPDLWGFALQQKGPDPGRTAVSVENANATDCAGYPDNLTGMAKCMISMARKYAPNARVGLHASSWSSGIDALYNSDPRLDVTDNALKVASFLLSCGAGDGDFIGIEASDRDAGYYQTKGLSTFWDTTNASLPDFTQALTWAKTLTATLRRPAIAWQIPLGNMSLPNATGKWQDNRVDYLLAHPAEVSDAHIVALAFGAGAADQTTPESDGGNFTARVRTYQNSGGATVCP